MPVIDKISGAGTACREVLSPGSPQRKLRWEKLDNAARLFSVVAGEHTSNVFRISVTLREKVEPELLQQALDLVLPGFDSFNVRLRKGFFWPYFEENGKPAPRVREERGFPCRYIHANINNSYLFRVSYYNCRINLEVFHVLTDGLGALLFLKELTCRYLRLRHRELAEICGDGPVTGTPQSLEDSFEKYCKKTSLPDYRLEPALALRGERLPDGELGIIHGYLSISELRQLSRSLGLTINEYLVSVFVWSIYKGYLRGRPSKRPIRMAIPVNLRPYFGSATCRNFFAILSTEFRAEREGHSFEEVCAAVRSSLQSQMNMEHIEKLLSKNVFYQQNPLLKILPLPAKHLCAKLVYAHSVRASSSTVSNIGKIELDEPYRPYIRLFHAFMPLSKGQHIKGTICSYEDTLVFTFSYDLADSSVQREFFRKLSGDGLRVETESNGVHYA